MPESHQQCSRMLNGSDSGVNGDWSPNKSGWIEAVHTASHAEILSGLMYVNCQILASPSLLRLA